MDAMWKRHEICLRLKGPMHIGYRMAGNLRMTRGYVPGRVLWGALTAALTDGRLGPAAFDAVGRQINEELRLEYFYASDHKNSVPVRPWEPGFAWLHLGSWTSTAMRANSRTHEDFTLHETEMLGERTREGKPVYLLGAIWAKAGCDLDWQGVLPRLELGGERSYGWGRVEVERIHTAGERERPAPIVRVEKDGRFLAHVAAEDGRPVEGAVEPLVGRITVANEFGRSFSAAQICWAPGAVWKGPQAVSCRLGPFGVWTLEGGNGMG